MLASLRAGWSSSALQVGNFLCQHSCTVWIFPRRLSVVLPGRGRLGCHCSGNWVGKMRGFSILYDNGQVISTRPLASSPEVLWYTFFDLKSFCKERRKVDILAMWHEREQAGGMTASYFLFLSTSVAPIQTFTFTFTVSILEFNIFFGLFSPSLLLIYSFKIITSFCSFPFFHCLTEIWWGFRRK